MAKADLCESEKKALEARLVARETFEAKGNAVRVLSNRYLRDVGGELEKPEEMFARVAVDVASAERAYNAGCDVYPHAEKFYDMMIRRQFMPNSPTLMNAGRRTEQQLAACFVLPIGDKFGSESSRDGIWDTYKAMALIHQSGGGTGFSFNRLRPRGSTVLQKEDFGGLDTEAQRNLNLEEKSIFWLKPQGIASGPFSFLEVYNTATNVIKQGGTRRGANMGIIGVYHPDSLDFIHAKDDPKKITNFNISIGVDEEFMRLATENGFFRFVNPHTKRNLNAKEIVSEEEYQKIRERGMLPPCLYARGKDLIDAYTGKIVGRLVGDEVQLSAKAYFDAMVEAVWRTGDPGIVFLDRINRDNPTPAIGEIESTNPCGEQPLLPYEACNLGSVNLARFVSNVDIDYNGLREVVHAAVRFLDDVIERSDYPLQEIRELVRGNRKIGFGVMGLADMLIELGLDYSTEEARRKAAEVMAFVDKESKKASIKLAEERGAFPNYEESVWKRKIREKYSLEGKLRNATTTTIAPTGTISIIADASSGIEPLFGVAFKRTVMDREVLPHINERFREIATQQGFYSDKLLEKIVSETQKGRISGMEEIPEDVRRLFRTTLDIQYTDQLRMQSALQEYVDNAVSKTINLPNSATREDVAGAFMFAYELGNIKGVTIYRDESREQQVISFSEKKEERRGITMEKRPEVVSGKTIKIQTGCGNLFITRNVDKEGKRLFEAFLTHGKAGGCAASQMEALGRLISYAARIGGSEEEIIGQLLGIRCNRPYPRTPAPPSQKAESCADAIAKALAKVTGRDLDSFYKMAIDGLEEKTFDSEDFRSPFGEAKHPSFGERVGNCPSPGCGGELVMVEGCRGGMCINCGYSECG